MLAQSFKKHVLRKAQEKQHYQKAVILFRQSDSEISSMHSFPKNIVQNAESILQSYLQIVKYSEPPKFSQYENDYITY